ncbi:site-specific DNA-methyltransferase [Methanosalsum zhilinae]|uniref:site-specific DNA-methyltransferase n=1 Tax=Methanosalsum zhilinae TaxID=39669 RepID=UPI0006623776|nr:site-specific DNA-methyltransferase [Methanosalsum zhilinae]
MLSTDYCITLDYIDEKYYPYILQNKKQLSEWEELYSFDINDEVTTLKTGITNVDKTNQQIMIEVLKQNPTLSIDTKFYDTEFKYQILSEIENLDEKTNGILINSDNFHALNLLLNKYKEKINFCYIDPPYNTGSDAFLYKDGFSHSSWLSLISNRLIYLKYLLLNDAVSFISIDDNEVHNLRNVCDGIFGQDNFIELFIVRSNPRGNQAKKYTASEHEYMVCYSKNVNKFNPLGFPKDNHEYKKRDDKGLYRELGLRKRGAGATREDAPNQYYPIYYNPTTEEISIENKSKDFVEIIPKLSNGTDGRWRWSKLSVATKKDELMVRLVNRNGAKVYDVFQKDYFSENKISKMKSILYEKDVNYENGTEELKNFFDGKKVFNYPKPVYLIKRILESVNTTDGVILDFFAGSGTTAHSVLKLNKEDEGNRKFVLVEMGQYFDTVIKPRILKVIYSDNWKNGVPQDNNGYPKQIIKYQSIEQYEDSLNNIDFKEPSTLVTKSKDYKIKYMLEFESRDNNVFLNLDALDNPFNYTLKIYDNNEVKKMGVDLIETFNYIAGIHINSIERKDDGEIQYVVVKGFIEEKNIIVLWRNKTENFDPEKDKEFVEAEILLNDEYDEIFVNGNSLIEGAKSIDEIFKANMFRV